jgi:hypothetical protein
MMALCKFSKSLKGLSNALKSLRASNYKVPEGSPIIRPPSASNYKVVKGPQRIRPPKAANYNASKSLQS